MLTAYVNGAYYSCWLYLRLLSVYSTPAAADAQSLRMEMSKNTVEQFEQARVLLAFAARLGRVVDSRIRSEIIRLQRPIARGSATIEDEQSLNEQITALISLIAPKDLAEAKICIEAEDANRARHTGSITATFLNIFGIILTIFIMSLTTAYTMLTTNLQDLKPDSTKYLEAVESIYSKSHPASGAASSADAAALDDEIEKVREQDGLMSSAVHNLRSMVQIEGNGLNWCVITFQMFWDSSRCYTSYNYEALNPAGSNNITNGSNAGIPTADVPLGATVIDVPTVQVVGTEGADEFTKLQTAKISYAVELGLSLAYPGQINLVYLLRSKAIAATLMLGTAILPLLYGFLGASVFLMRQYFANTRFFPTDDHIVGRVLLRLGLGGVAGLAIGWFWSPANTKLVTDATTFSMTPFALAFLAGFSIELLFSILDRVIAAVTPSGKPPG